MKNIKIIILDVDGTLTDGKIYYDSNGHEMKAFNVKDGMAIAQAISCGIEVGIVTGRESSIVEKRAGELKVKYLYQGIHNKVEVIDEILNSLKLNYSNAMYIGDDINDLDIMNRIGVSACPKDACEDILERCDIVSRFNGGEGAVREIIEILLKKQGKWNFIISKYTGITQ